MTQKALTTKTQRHKEIRQRGVRPVVAEFLCAFVSLWLISRLNRHGAAGPLLESCFDGIHSLVGVLHGVPYACGIGRDTGQSAAHAEKHFPVWLVCGIPNHHVAEFSDLRAKVVSLGEGQDHELDRKSTRLNSS